MLLEHQISLLRIILRKIRKFRVICYQRYLFNITVLLYIFCSLVKH